jgi:hypothetical protein
LTNASRATGFLGNPSFGCAAVVGNPLGQLKCLYNTAGRLRFDCENHRLIVIVGKSMWLPDMRGRTVSWQKQQIFLVSVHLDVQLSLLHGEGLDEIHMVIKRRTGAVRRRTNFEELASCTAVLLLADEQG